MYDVHRTCAETAAVSRVTSHVTIKTALQPHWWILKTRYVKLQPLVQSRTRLERSGSPRYSRHCEAFRAHLEMRHSTSIKTFLMRLCQPVPAKRQTDRQTERHSAHIHMHTHTHTHTQTSHTHTHIHLHTDTHARTYARARTHTHTHTHTPINITLGKGEFQVLMATHLWPSSWVTVQARDSPVSSLMLQERWG